MNRGKANFSLPPSFSLQRKRKFNERRRREGGREQVGRRKGEWRIWSRKGQRARETAGLPGALQETRLPCSSPGEVEAHSPRLSLFMQKVGISREASLILLKRYTCVCVFVRVWVFITWPLVFLVAITYQSKKINYETISQFIPSLIAAITVNSKFNM